MAGREKIGKSSSSTGFCLPRPPSNRPHAGELGIHLRPEPAKKIVRRERIGENTPWACFRLRYAQIGLRPPQRPCRAFVEPPDWYPQEKIGRRERIRTSGPYVPNVVLYQAELLSEPVREDGPLASGGALITMPPRPRNRTRNPWPDGHFDPFAPLAGWLYTGRRRGFAPATCWGVAKW